MRAEFSTNFPDELWRILQAEAREGVEEIVKDLIHSGLD